ncbi:flagellar hook-length control protein FliK [Marinimicrobium alkaliphilum]|uniref:flagellar hook-length control protein FliK n=1 Tax=Marinimicrobium alkaliphilum TaxID=2202654 RepID=UPI0013006BBB|nr:flagellar hook-length control protein FliK [Marinimicrobium alkaliphilum]
MVIKLPTTPPPPAASGAPADVAATGRVITLPPGKLLNAVVEQSTPMTPTQRETLTNQTLQALLLLGKQPSSNTQQVRFNALLEQQQLLNKPELFLTRLRLAPRLLLAAYTDRPLPTGQPLKLEMARDQRLLFQPGQTQTPASPLPQNTTASSVDRTAQHQMALADALRQLLPKKDQPDLRQLQTQIQNLSPTQARTFERLLPAAIDQALRQLNTMPLSPDQLKDPAQVQKALRDSGVFLEHKLTQQPQGADSPRPATPGSAPPPALAQDYKGALLQLLARLEQQLPGSTRTDGGPPERPVATGLNLLQLLQQPLGGPRADLSERVMRTQLMQLMQQHTLASLARVQLAQLQTVNHQLTQADSPQPTQSWSFEVPIRLGMETRMLALKIDEEDEEDEDEAGTGRKRRWSVMMSFDLPVTGPFHAQLSLIEKSLAVRLWAEQESTLKTTRKHMTNLQKQLEAQGISVTRMECHSGPPPKAGVSLNYSLVDIKT